jgi:hypothetical protein
MRSALGALCDLAYETRLNASGPYAGRVRVGQVVYVRSLVPYPYIAVVRRVRRGVATMQWFYRPDDVPAAAMARMAYAPAAREIFLSSDRDENGLETIVGPCDVASVDGGRGYFCRAEYTGTALVPCTRWESATG